MDNIVLHLTEGCNLRCKYCFMKPGEQKMTEEIAFAAMDAVFASGKNYVRVLFYGGEPLLEESLLRKVVEYISTIETSLTIYLGVVTNGTLLNEDFLEYAKEHNIIIAVSYDGLQNNDNRVNENDCALLDINKIKDKIIKYKLYSSSVITPKNVNIFSDNIFHLYDLGFRHMNLFLDYSASWNAKHVEILRKEYEKIAGEYVKWIQNNDKASINKIDDMISCYLSDFELSKTKVRRDMAYSIAVNGNIYPYAGAVGNKNLLLGNVISGIDWNKIEKINNFGLVKGCETCPLNQACVSAIGNIITDDLKPIALPIACHGYKIAFDTADWIVNKLLD
ncbi:MAG: 4Fe-4S cluster-binding domain-containing protein [Oscillospiraceae bacterium]|nr:4Fe-4S cluster-binding domain-containing protein [Oscillospiraceae bacterium]